MLFIVISETLYSYSCNNRKLVCSMLSSAVFHKTSPGSSGWNMGRSGFSEPGCHNQELPIPICKYFWAFVGMVIELVVMLKMYGKA